jgi:hypothetical protein
VIVRADLPPGDQAVQAAHAAVEFALRFPGQVPETLVLLAAGDELELDFLIELLSGDVAYCTFREPDLGGSLTAVALAETRLTRRMTAGYPLALREGVKR